MNKNLWDQKAKTYGKFSKNLSEFQIKFFEILDNFDIKFENKTIVDIGCGTGIYSLYLANFCKNILGVDSSKEMLKEFENSAKKYNITNTKTILSNFANFKSDEKFDIAFLTMSPALQNESDFAKFINLANLRIYMNWEKQRNSTLLNPFFEKYKKSENEPIVFKLERFLKNQNIPFKTQILNEVRHSKRTLNEAFENVKWHLSFIAKNIDEQAILNDLNKQIKDGFIDDEVEIFVKIIVF